MTEIHPTLTEIKDALNRIAMTPDGHNLYIFLQRRLMKVPDPQQRGALRANQGERSFALELIGLMAKGIAESVNRTSSSAGSSSSGAEQPVVLPTAEPVAVARARGAGRRITADTRVPGWDRAPEDE
jgi:hypothetical protein